MVRTAGLLVCSGCAALLGCYEAPTAPAPDLELHLDSYSYVSTRISADPAQYAFRVVVRYENTTSSSIWFEMCGPGDRSPIFGVPTADGSESGYDIGWACVGTPPLEFPPGAARADTLQIWGPTVFDHYTHRPFGVITGYFRLEYSSLKCDTCSEPGPRVASAPFLVSLR